MDKDSWISRCAAQFEKVAGVPEKDAFFMAGVAFDETHDDFEDDPEGAADSEMSYWDDDA
jgi:hypothetical protein